MIAALKLLAGDAEDLVVISASMQNAVLRLGGIQWRPQAAIFTIDANRYCWEQTSGLPKRVRTILQFGSVLDAQGRRLRQGAPDAVIELLDIAFEPDQAPPGGTVLLRFAGNADLRLKVEALDVILSDRGSSWAAKSTPSIPGD